MNQRALWAFASAGWAIAAVLLLGGAGDPARVVKAERFEVIDRDGKTRFSIGIENGAIVASEVRGGTVVASSEIGRDGSSLELGARGVVPATATRDAKKGKTLTAQPAIHLMPEAYHVDSKFDKFSNLTTVRVDMGSCDVLGTPIPGMAGIPHLTLTYTYSGQTQHGTSDIMMMGVRGSEMADELILLAGTKRLALVAQNSIRDLYVSGANVAEFAKFLDAMTIEVKCGNIEGELSAAQLEGFKAFVMKAMGK